MKYQIFGPNGNKVCIVEAYAAGYTVDGTIALYETSDVYSKHVAEFPDTWVAIPIDCIEKDESKKVDEIIKENACNPTIQKKCNIGGIQYTDLWGNKHTEFI